MPGSNKHTQLGQAIASIKEALVQTTKMSEYEKLPLLQFNSSTKKHPAHNQTEQKPAITMNNRQTSIASRHGSGVTSTQQMISAAQLVDMTHREAMFHHMAMRA